MSEHILEWKTAIPAPREVVFALFSDAANLERLTPPSLGFRILNTASDSHGGGDAHRLRHSSSRNLDALTDANCNSDPPSGFIDEQIKGPYRKSGSPTYL